MKYGITSSVETTRRETCRICDSENLSEIISFGNLLISTFVEQEGNNLGRAPLELIKCNNCELVQLRHTAPQELLYKAQYWYKSGINPVIVEDLREIAVIAQKHMRAGDIIIDVGANDGTLLGFIPKDYYRVGIEPAKNLVKELETKCDMTFQGFWETFEYPDKAKVITAIGMFYDSENPNLFIANVKKHLAEDGLFISQFMTLKPMIEKNDLGNIVHEHLEYYSYKSVKYLFEKNGLEIFKVEENDINGGSYRLYARHFNRGSVFYPEPEFAYDKFVADIKENRDSVYRFVRDAVNSGKKVYGYGASTKGNTILQYYGLDKDLITGIADLNPEKIGKLSVGTHIPVVHEDEARRDADYFLILPWGFLDFFREKERDWREKGGRFITHTPKFTVQ